jgi:hypothetical protein
MMFSSGANFLFLHHWVPNLSMIVTIRDGMEWWGTHYEETKNDKAGKSIFAYIALCQMILQQGLFVPQREIYCIGPCLTP